MESFAAGKYESLQYNEKVPVRLDSVFIGRVFPVIDARRRALEFLFMPVFFWHRILHACLNLSPRLSPRFSVKRGVFE